jgi:hypothetical protein
MVLGRKVSQKAAADRAAEHLRLISLRGINISVKKRGEFLLKNVG